MKANQMLRLVLTSMLLCGFSTVMADDSTDESANVWAVVEEEWNASAKGDQKSIERLLSDDVAVWDIESPAPRNKASIKMWNRFQQRLGKTVAHELYPLSIIVHGDTAVAHYLYSSAFENKDGDIKMSSGRYTDILVRSEDGWKFLAWHGGDDE